MELTEEQNIKQKSILLETLSAFQTFCNQYGLMYYACSGTALGAIRHKGFIPWDDDIDVVMPREDYDRLKNLSCHLKNTGYELLSYENCKGYTAAFMKFCNSNTTIWELKNNPCILGVYIDIFPLDEAIDQDSAQPLFNKYNRYFKYAYEKRFHDYELLIKGFHMKGLIRKVWHILFHKFYVNKFNKLENEICSVRGQYYIFYGGFYKIKSELGLKEWYSNGKIVAFENINIRVPQNYDAYLTNMYGDYMTPPPLDKRISHHDRYYVNLDKRMTIKEVLALNIKAEEKKSYIYE